MIIFCSLGFGSDAIFIFPILLTYLLYLYTIIAAYSYLVWRCDVVWWQCAKLAFEAASNTDWHVTCYLTAIFHSHQNSISFSLSQVLFSFTNPMKRTETFCSPSFIYYHHTTSSQLTQFEYMQM